MPNACTPGTLVFRAWAALALLALGCHFLELPTRAENPPGSSSARVTPQPELNAQPLKDPNHLEVALDGTNKVFSGSGSRLDRAIAPLEAQHPRESGFRLLSEGPEAFAVRAQSARLASRTLDVQTYIWHDDLTGLFLAHTLLEAADRGVQVRLLVDDMDARAMNAGFAALAAHPNIEVRLFNPFRSRKGTVAFMSEALFSFRRINHRMHNKSWIADQRLAVVGGRNLGNEYFGASEEVNFIDLDFAMFGPIVRDVSASFDRYWNSEAAFPMESLDARSVNAPALETLRSRLASEAEKAMASSYAELLRRDDAVIRMTRGDVRMEWSNRYKFVADDPLKARLKSDDTKRSQVMTELWPVMSQSQDMAIISPYFVPGKRGTRRLTRAASSGSRVRIITNSLVANDVPAVHGGYSRHREVLLEGGVQLWELKPTSGEAKKSGFFGSSGASLHTKALLLDERILFVGSYNLDPRSTWLNCEQGVFVENEILALQLEEIFRGQTSGARAWSVYLNQDKVEWSDETETFSSDPKASFSRKVQAWLARTLRLDAQL